MANIGKLALAVLGILAYQNRDKIGDMLRRSDQSGDPNEPQQDGLMDQLTKGMSGTALGDILEKFRSAGSGEKVDSWVRKGPNQPVEPREVEAAIDDETLAALSRQTGLSREELIARISQSLPDAVDAMTPDGELPLEQSSADSDGPNLLDDVEPGSFRQSSSRQSTPSPATEKVSGAGPAVAEHSKDAQALRGGRQPGAYVKE